MSAKVELGDKVKHSITGVVGIVTMHEKHLFKCDRYQISDQKGMEAKILTVDAGSVKIVKKQVIKPTRVDEDEEKIQLGDLCKDLVTGFEGVATCREYHINRCDRIELAPVVKKDNKLGDNYSFDAQSLKVLKRQHVKKQQTSEPQKNTGCAMSKKPRD